MKQSGVQLSAKLLEKNRTAFLHSPINIYLSSIFHGIISCSQRVQLNKKISPVVQIFVNYQWIYHWLCINYCIIWSKWFQNPQLKDLYYTNPWTTIFIYPNHSVNFYQKHIKHMSLFLPTPKREEEIFTLDSKP